MQNQPPIKPIIAYYWLAAARAEFAKPDDWRAWTDKAIISMPASPYWVIAISLTLNVTELGKVLSNEVSDKMEETTMGWMDDAIIGYIWWKFERQEIGLNRCLRLIGVAADGSDSKIHCEEVYALLNELEAENKSETDIEADTNKLLSPLRDLAKEQWLEIQSCV